MARDIYWSGAANPSPEQTSIAGATPETTVSTGGFVAFSAGSGDHFVGRDVTNNVEVLMGTLGGAAIVGTATNHSLVIRTNGSNRASFRAGGGFAVGGGAAALATNATDGFLYVPTCAGPPTGVPGDAPTGTVALVFDTTNNKLYIYDGSWLGGTTPGAFV
jgi:hypothetical protein